MTVAQILAVSIFVVMFVLMVLDKIEKQYITLVAGALTLILVFGVAMHSMDAVIETLNVRIFSRRDSGLHPVRVPRSHPVSTGRRLYSLQV